jgi:NAD(P)-dependent dehydrogenase (short-subunit alcohol dehydrogenase family)
MNTLIVGGSSGIGFEIVKQLASGDHRVIVASRNSGSLAAFDNVRHVPLDVRQGSFELEGLPETLQGLVYCPGSINLKPFQRLTAQDFMDDFQINLLGAVTVLQGCLMKLKKSSQGASVVMFSTVAVRTGMPFHASIASAKGAVEGLVRSLAAEWAPRIRINAIAPSLTDTGLARDLLSSTEKRKASAERHPLKRIADPAEIANLAAYLLSEPAAWITGQVFHVDGGMSAVRTFR